MLNRFILIVFGLLTVDSISAQTLQEIHEFEEELRAEANAIYPNITPKIIDLEDIDDQVIQNSLDAFPPSNTDWEIMAEYYFYNQVIVGQEYKPLPEPNFMRNWYEGKQAVYTLEELMTKLNATKGQPFKGRYIPVVGRRSIHGGKWYAYTDGNYLVLKLAHDYPDGNQTSYYLENRIYFKRVN